MDGTMGSTIELRADLTAVGMPAPMTRTAGFPSESAPLPHMRRRYSVFKCIATTARMPPAIRVERDEQRRRHLHA